MKTFVDRAILFMLFLSFAIGKGEGCITAKGIAMTGSPSGQDLVSLDTPGIQFLLAIPAANFLGVPIPGYDMPDIPGVVQAALKVGLQLETPLQFFIGGAVDISRYHSQTRYHPTALDVFGVRKEPICTEGVNPVLLKAHARLAEVIADVVAVTESLKPIGLYDQIRSLLEAAFASYGLSNILEIALSDEFDGCANLEFPWGLGKCEALQFTDYVFADHFGWNVFGTTGGCTANCHPFSDFSIDGYSAYKPSNNPFTWEPLRETDGKGYFTRQEHVTPYIGFTSKLYGYGSRDEQCDWLKGKSLGKPNYKYDEELRFVLDQTASLAVNDTLKMRIEAFDSKLSSIFVQGSRYALTSMDRNDPFYDFKYAQYGSMLGVAAHNALILVWREKVLQDLIRPTTVAEREDKASYAATYAGPYQGLKNITVKDWEPYIRTMPHAEFPSGSSCACEAFREFSVAYFGTDDLGPFADSATLFFPAGSSKVEPGQTPSQDVLLSFTSFSQIAQVCGQSRTDGGMHFSKSVAGGVELCSGIGEDLIGLVLGLEAGDSSARLLDPNDSTLAACPAIPKKG